ncbi:hypothetical protein PDK11_20460 [Bacillus cereus]|nr:hypothetical protein [Bacillus cereus]
MIKKWLRKNNEDNSTYGFTKVEFIELMVPDEEIINYVGLNLLQAFRDPNALKKEYKDEAPEKLIEYLKKYAFANIEEETKEKGIRKNVRQGDFGETLAMELVKKFDELHIPICKIRWKFNNNRSVFCTDMLSHNEGETITDLKYYEIKSRITMGREKVKINNQEKSHYVGVVAHQSLLKDESSPNTEVIADYLFRYYYNLAETLAEHGGDEAAEQYYKTASRYSDIVKHPEKYNRAFEIIIIVEKSLYKEEVLKELNNLPPQLSPLEVKIILVDDLKLLYEKVYEKSIEIAIEKVYKDEKKPIS